MARQYRLYYEFESKYVATCRVDITYNQDIQKSANRYGCCNMRFNLSTIGEGNT